MRTLHPIARPTPPARDTGPTPRDARGPVRAGELLPGILQRILMRRLRYQAAEAAKSVGKVA